jgi:predicted RNase H-like nuclease
VPTVLGLDARNPRAWVTVRLEDGNLAAIENHPAMDPVLDKLDHVDAVGVNVPVGHDDPTGERRGGRRACDVEARELLGDKADRVYWTPPFEVFEADTYEKACEIADSHGWPEPAKGMYKGKERLFAINDAAIEARNIVEIHPAVSWTALNERHGGSGPLVTYGRGPQATYKRLQLLGEDGLRPARSLGGVGMLDPSRVLDASIAAWSADRIATKDAVTLPEDPPRDPSTGRRVAIRY